MSWNYQRDESTGFKPIPVGDYRIRIKKAEKTVSKTSGNEMLSLEFEVSGQKSKIFHNIVFLPDRPEITNRNLTQFFDSFKDIPEGDFNTANWVGKIGACHVKHEEYNGNMNAKVQYFIGKDKQGILPAWVEPENGSQTVMGAGAPNVNVPANVDEEVPF
jgi:hypothetical protein